MTTQPPSPEAVEAARKYALNDKHLSRSDCALLYNLRLNNKEQIEEAVARILAAEVERLRAELDRRHKEYASALNRRVDVENALAMVAAGKRDLLTREECRELAIKLGVSPAAPCTKQP